MDWLNATAMLLLIAGHCELLVTLMNRTHSFPIHFQWLKHFRHIDDIMIPVFPIAFVWFQGLNGAELLTGGSWDSLPLRWVVYLSVCGLGTAGFLFSIVRWQLYRIPDRQTETAEDTKNIQSRFEQSLIGRGPYQFLTWFPLNECLELTVARKTIEFPNLPEAWDGLTITHVSDLHLIGTIKRDYFASVIDEAIQLESDLAVFTGDLIDRMDLLDWIPETLGRLDAPMGRYFLLGNHDWDQQQDVIRAKTIEAGWTDVGSRMFGLPYRGHLLALGGTEYPWMGSLPEFEQIPNADFRLLLSHTPDNIFWARDNNIDLVLAGHTHGGQVTLPLIGPVYSPSRNGVRFAAGSFEMGETFLHVSRGIAGKHTLRWRCRPELIQLKLIRSPTGSH